MQVLVFRTNLNGESDVIRVSSHLDALPEIRTWNVDLEDCDRVLRIESTLDTPEKVINLIAEHGYSCEELPD